MTLQHASTSTAVEGLRDTGRAYLNLAESPVATRSAYGADRWRRLTAVRSAVDPQGLFAANHPIPAAG